MPDNTGRQPVTVDDVRRLVRTFPRTEEHVIHDRIKFRVGSIVYVAFSRDETIMGFAFPKEERAALIAAEPEKFELPSVSDQRYNWVHVRLAAIDVAEMTELVTEAWRMVVPKRVAAARLADQSARPGLTTGRARTSSPPGPRTTPTSRSGA